MKRSRIDALLRQQEGMDDISRESIEAMQLQKLNRLLSLEKQRQGFYKELPAALSALSELESLPFTTDEDLASRGGELLLCSQGDVERVLSDATSGTTGSAKRVFYTRGDCERTLELFAAGLGELVFPGDAVLICMPFSGPYGLGELIAEAIALLGARPIKAGGGLSYGELRELMRLERPQVYVGMPTALLSLLRYCGRGSLRRALVSGDACPEQVAAQCEALLGSRLFPHYGSREMALGGAICCQAHEGMHLRENHVITEIVDHSGTPLPAGQPGELVITTIGMEAQPLIRYRTGDYTRILPGPCPCGSRVLRLDSVRRRGPAAEMAALDQALFTLPGLVDYRAERDKGRLRVRALGLPPLRAEDIRRLCPDAAVDLRPAADGDRPLYAGKRRVEEIILP